MHWNCPFTMIASRVHSASHSSMLCVVSTISRPDFTTSLSVFHRKRLAPGSMPDVCCGKQSLSCHDSSYRFVEEDNGRIPDQCNGRAQLPLVAAAVRACLPLGMLNETQTLDQIIDNSIEVL